MDRDRDEQRCENDLDQLVKQAFGIDDDQLLRDFLLAQTEIKDSQIPPEPENGFECLLGKVGERGIEPRYNSEDMHWNEHREKVKRKYRRVKPLLRVAVAVGALLVLLVAMGMTAGAKRSYKYYVTEKSSAKNSIAINNIDSLRDEDILEDAYKEIANTLNMDIVRMGYMPEIMEYMKTVLNNERATMYFKYGENRFYVVQQKDTVGSTINIISDRNKSFEVYNEWLQKDIVVEEATTEEGKTELSAYIVDDDRYYQLSGIMDKTVFEKIIKAVYLERKN